MNKAGFYMKALMLILMLSLPGCSYVRQTESAGNGRAETKVEEDSSERAESQEAEETEETEETEKPDETAEKKSRAAVSAEQLEAELAEQPVVIIRTEYVVQSEDLKALYPDMLQAVIQNNSEDDVKSIVVAFAAWDENNLPVKIRGQYDFTGGKYVRKVEFDEANLVPGGVCGEDEGYCLEEESGIQTFKAIVVSYETFDGRKWFNPCYDDFYELYAGKKLNGV